TCPAAGSVCPVPSARRPSPRFPISTPPSHTVAHYHSSPAALFSPSLSNAPKTSLNPLYFKSLLSVSGVAACLFSCRSHTVALIYTGYHCAKLFATANNISCRPRL
ncbi:hypothetical protein CORC01_03585, partial [Colletotrichum orchidophilum]